MIAPHDINAEKAVIGSILTSDGVIDSIRDFLIPEDFYEMLLGKIYSVMLAMRSLGKAIDVLTVKHEMGQEVTNKDLVDCMEAPSTYHHIREYARIVAEKSYERKIIDTCRDMAKHQEPEIIKKITDLVNAKQALYDPATFNYDIRLGEVIDGLYNKEKNAGYKTHVKDIDRVWWTMRPGEINVWGGATNVGKSLIMLNLMHRAALNGERCLFVGTEMSAVETIHRHLSIFTNIEPWKFRIPKLDDSEMKTVRDAVAERMYKLPVSILDIPEPSLDDIDRAIAGVKPVFVFLDYLERFRMPKEENLRLRIKEFMRRIKSIARQRSVIIHLAAQLNRTSYDEGKAPTMGQLSESSAIEKEADRVILFWCPPTRQPNLTDGRRVIEVVQAKNRHGKKGLTFDFILDEKNLAITTEEEHEAGYDGAGSMLINQSGAIRTQGPRSNQPGRADKPGAGGQIMQPRQPDSSLGVDNKISDSQPPIGSHGNRRWDEMGKDAYMSESDETF